MGSRSKRSRHDMILELKTRDMLRRSLQGVCLIPVIRQIMTAHTPCAQRAQGSECGTLNSPHTLCRWGKKPDTRLLKMTTPDTGIGLACVGPSGWFSYPHCYTCAATPRRSKCGVTLLRRMRHMPITNPNEKVGSLPSWLPPTVVFAT